MKVSFKKTAVVIAFSLIAGEVSAQTTWNVSLWGQRRALTEGIHKLAELVEQRTNGEWKFNLSYGGLSGSRENIDGISIGAFELAQSCSFLHPEKLPTFGAMDLPFLGITSVRQQGAFETLMLTQPELVADLARWNAVAIMPSPQSQYNLVGKGDPIESSKGLVGMRVRANGVMATALGKLDIVPAPIPPTEVYNALDSGVVDAVAFADHAHLAYRLDEVGDWWTDNLNPGTGNCPLIANKDAVDRLPEEHRKILYDAVPEAMEHYYQVYEKSVSDWNTRVDTHNLRRISLPESELAQIREATKSVHQDWVTQQETAGRKGQVIYDAVLRAVETTKH